MVQSVEEDYFGENIAFGSAQGFDIAVAIFDPFTELRASKIDPSIGRIVFKKVEWGFDETDEFLIESSVIPSGPCPEEVFDPDSERARFY